LFYFFFLLRRPPCASLFPYTTLFRSIGLFLSDRVNQQRSHLLNLDGYVPNLLKQLLDQHLILAKSLHMYVHSLFFPPNNFLFICSMTMFNVISSCSPVCIFFTSMTHFFNSLSPRINT